MKYFVLGLFTLSLISCNNTNQKMMMDNSIEGRGQQLIEAAIEAHGGSRYDNAHYQFVFRDKTYTFKNDGQQYRYELSMNKESAEYLDVLDNEGFSRQIDGKNMELTKKQIRVYGNALNSVIYFATLPHKLKDPAVKNKYIGQENIANEKYEVVEISFSEENGGVDHDDMYYYWINSKSKLIDYFAYNYQVNNGGVRFRTASNPRTVDGIIFQDYVNYKAEVGTPLGELPKLWEEGKLKKLSEINTEEVVRLR